MAQPVGYTSEETNFFRLQKLVGDVGATVLRKILSTFFTGTTLQAYLTQPQQFNILSRLLNRKVIRPDEYGLLYPPGARQPDIAEFDVSLLYALIRNLGTVQPWPYGRGVVPAPMDTSLEADVERIKGYRNDLAHRRNNALNDADYASFSLELVTAYRRRITAVSSQSVSLNTINDQITNTLSSTLDPAKEKELLNVLISWLNDLRQNATVRQETTEDELAVFVANEQQFFVRTQDFERAMSTLETKNLVVVTGNGGSGKLYLARHLTKEYCRKNPNTRPVVCKSPRDFSKLKFGGHRLVLIENFCGKYRLERTYLNQWNELEARFNTYLTSKKLSLIITVRSRILKMVLPKIARQQGLAIIRDRGCHVVLSNTSLTTVEKEQMFAKHTGKTQTESHTILEGQNVENIPRAIGFPSLCRLARMCCSDNDLNALFETEIPYLMKHELQMMLEEDPNQYMTLVVALACDGRLVKDMLTVKEGEHFKDIAKKLGRETISACNKKKSCQVMVGEYLEEDGAVYQLVKDDFVRRTILASLKDNFPSERNGLLQSIKNFFIWLWMKVCQICSFPYDLIVECAKYASQ